MKLVAVVPLVAVLSLATGIDLAATAPDRLVFGAVIVVLGAVIAFLGAVIAFRREIAAGPSLFRDQVQFQRPEKRFKPAPANKRRWEDAADILDRAVRASA